MSNLVYLQVSPAVSFPRFFSEASMPRQRSPGLRRWPPAAASPLDDSALHARESGPSGASSTTSQWHPGRRAIAGTSWRAMRLRRTRPKHLPNSGDVAIEISKISSRLWTTDQDCGKNGRSKMCNVYCQTPRSAFPPVTEKPQKASVPPPVYLPAVLKQAK